MIPAKRTGTTKTVFESLTSRQLIMISIISSVVLFILSLIGDLKSDVEHVINNPTVYFIISMIALQTAIKRREQENEIQYQPRSTKYDLYENIPSDNDLHITAVIFLVSSAFLIARFGTPLLPISIGIVAFVGLFFRISPAYGNSMLPKIVYGDWIITERWLLRKRKIKRGDIVYFPSPPGLKIEQHIQKLRRWKSSLPFRTSLLKRVIAMPGETLRITNGKVYINNIQLQEEETVPSAVYEINYLGDLGNYLYKPYSEPEYATKPIVVPEGHYFLLGDLRINENVDSHVFGFVPEKQIQGRMLVLFPFAKQSIKRSDLCTLAEHLSVAKKLYQEKQFEKLIEECNRAITLYDKCAPAYAYRAVAKKNLKRIDEAIEDCNQAIYLYKKTKDLLPGFWENIGFPYAVRAITYIQFKKYTEAVNDLNKAIKLIPNRGDFYYHRSQAHKALGNNILAENDLAKANELGYVPQV